MGAKKEYHWFVIPQVKTFKNSSSIHTHIRNMSLVGMSIWNVGPAANHGYMKVSDALR